MKIKHLHFWQIKGIYYLKLHFVIISSKNKVVLLTYLRVLNIIKIFTTILWFNVFIYNYAQYIYNYYYY